MRDGFRRIDLNDQDQGVIRLSIIIPTTDPWGAAAPLRDTPWGGLVREVSGESVSHAMHGYATPLVRQLGPPPITVARRMRVRCALADGGQCVGASASCVPGRDMPDCFDPPNLSPQIARVVATILLDLKSNRHVIITLGSEFVLM